MSQPSDDVRGDFALWVAGNESFFDARDRWRLSLGSLIDGDGDGDVYGTSEMPDFTQCGELRAAVNAVTTYDPPVPAWDQLAPSLRLMDDSCGRDLERFLDAAVAAVEADKAFWSQVDVSLE